MTSIKVKSERKKDIKADGLVKAQKANKQDVCANAKKRWGVKSEEKESATTQETRDKLIRKYAYLVNWVVNRLPIASLKGMDRDDLVGYGTIGLIESVDRFDPAKSTNFESFAIARIRGSVYDQLRAADWRSRGSRKRVKNLHKVTAILENKLGRYPNDIELEAELSVTLEDLRIIQQESQIGIFSLDEPKDASSDEGATMVENVSANTVPFLDELEETELKEKLAKAIDNLPEREKTVVGLYHYKKLTFKEIAEVMSFSESRASQIHARAITLLKSKMLKD